jgi:heme oxygenase
MASASVRAQLRLATAGIHEALHHAAPFARIAEGRMDLDGYGALLEMLYRYHATLAPVCAAGAAALGVPDLAEAHRQRLVLLRDDLQRQGRAIPAVPSETANDPGFNAGCLYTVQGSTLGGKVIFRQLDGLLPSVDGRRFFQGTPQDGGAWGALCKALEDGGFQPARLEAGARHAFMRFGEMLTA